MIYNLYSLRDKLKGYGVVTCKSNDEDAKRDFDMLVNDESPTLISCHPEDFELYCVGTFDSDSGEVTDITPIKLIVKGDSYVHK